MRNLIRVGKAILGGMNGVVGTFLSTAFMVAFILFWVAVIALLAGDETALDMPGWWQLGKTLVYVIDIVAVPVGFIMGLWFGYQNALDDEHLDARHEEFMARIHSAA